jgi:hypothetical protein
VAVAWQQRQAADHDNVQLADQKVVRRDLCWEPVCPRTAGPCHSGHEATRRRAATQGGGTIGLLENEGAGLSGAGSDGVYYRRFDPATSSFGAPALVSNEATVASGGAIGLSVSQDSAGDAYAAWLDSRGWMLSYSSSAGASWPTPVTIPIASSAADAVVAGAGGGSADLAYTATLGRAHTNTSFR